MMRKTFRLRTFLVALVLLAIPLAYFGDRWRRCDFEYFRRHAKLAQKYRREAAEARHYLGLYQRRVSRRQASPPEVASPSGSGSTVVQIPSLAQLQRSIARWRAAAKAADQKFRYHRRIAGRAYTEPMIVVL
jgi:hypothetical protein